MNIAAFRLSLGYHSRTPADNPLRRDAENSAANVVAAQ
jgi:hypothetical protein